MPRTSAALVNFNRGVVSKKALARVDLERVQVSAEMQTNWMPDELGPMSIRPGTEYIGKAKTDNYEAIYIPFVFSNDDTAIIEFSNSSSEANMRIRVADEHITRPVNTAVLSDEEFGNGTTDWLDDSDPGCTAQTYIYGPGSPTGLRLCGTRDAAARVYQVLTINEQDVLHGMTILVDKNYGSVVLFIGTALGLQDVLVKTELKPGAHSITFTPSSATVHIHFERQGYGYAVMDRCAVDPLVMDVPLARMRMLFNDVGAPESIRFVQSGDIVFCTNIGQYDPEDPQFQFNGTCYDAIGLIDKIIMFAIERRPNDSWSVVRYSPDNGPFGLINTSGVTVTPSSTDGDDVLLTASQSLFRIGHLNTLFRLESVGQVVTASLSGANQFTNAIRVTGVDTGRVFSRVISGTWAGTITLQRSIGVEGNWEDVLTNVANVTTTYDDTFDNSIIFYRVGFKAGNYTSGTADVSLSYATGSITGTCRIYDVSDDGLTASGMVIQPMGNTTASEAWYFSQWNYENGFPSAPEIFESRLWWCGNDKLWASVIDNFYNYDYQFEGDAGTIQRSIGYGPIERLRWMKAAQRIYMGGQTSEHVCKSSSLDEPVTPTVFSIKQASNAGSSNSDAVRIDGGIIFAQRGGRRLYELSLSDSGSESLNTDLTLFCPSILAGRVKNIAVVRAPNTRAHCILQDGTVAVLVYNRLEEVRAWVPLVLNERLQAISAFSLPSDDEEDALYYQVKVNDPGASDHGEYHLLKVARDDECIGGAVNKLGDSFVYSSTPIASVATTVATHFPEGTTVSVWADGVAYDDREVGVGGAVTLTGLTFPATDIVIGLPYEASYKSVKLAYGAFANGTALTQKKRVTGMACILLNTHKDGVRYGPDFDHLDALPLEDFKAPDGVRPEVYAEFDEEIFEFNGEWDTDSRICIWGRTPKPATVVAVIGVLQTNTKE